MNRSWVRFPQAAQIRPPGFGWAFLYALTGRAALCARGRRPAVRAACCCLLPHGCSGRRRARPPARLGDLTAFGAAPRSPPVPSGPSGALHTGGAVSLCMAERVGSKPGQALPPPTGAAARPTNPFGIAPRSPLVPLGQALSTRRPGCLKPVSPLLACACVGLKPSSPLRVRNGRFWCIFRWQW